jgi:hypothetical protein
MQSELSAVPPNVEFTLLKELDEAPYSILLVKFHLLIC